jgi:hypothetical protein
MALRLTSDPEVAVVRVGDRCFRQNVGAGATGFAAHACRAGDTARAPIADGQHRGAPSGLDGVAYNDLMDLHDAAGRDADGPCVVAPAQDSVGGTDLAAARSRAPDRGMAAACAVSSPRSTGDADTTVEGADYVSRIPVPAALIGLLM